MAQILGRRPEVRRTLSEITIRGKSQQKRSDARIQCCMPLTITPIAVRLSAAGITRGNVRDFAALRAQDRAGRLGRRRSRSRADTHQLDRAAWRLHRQRRNWMTRRPQDKRTSRRGGESSSHFHKWTGALRPVPDYGSRPRAKPRPGAPLRVASASRVPAPGPRLNTLTTAAVLLLQGLLSGCFTHIPRESAAPTH